MDTKYKKVMLIDDNELDIYITSKIILNTKLAEIVLEYTSAEEALQYLIENKEEPEKLPSLIFLDIYMPRMNGFEFIDKVKVIEPSVTINCKICIVSSTVSHYDIHKAKVDKGIPLFTSKPISKEFLESLMLK